MIKFLDKFNYTFWSRNCEITNKYYEYLDTIENQVYYTNERFVFYFNKCCPS